MQLTNEQRNDLLTVLENCWDREDTPSRTLEAVMNFLETMENVAEEEILICNGGCPYCECMGVGE